jgi:transposase
MKAYSVDLRGRIVQFVRNGHTKAEAARHFEVSWRTVLRYCKAEREEGRLAPKPRPGRKQKFPSERLLQEVRAHPSATLEEHARALGVSHVAVWLRLGRLGITLKKTPALRREGRAGQVVLPQVARGPGRDARVFSRRERR